MPLRGCTTVTRIQYGAGDQIADLVRRGISATGTQAILDAVEHVGPDRLPGLAKVLGWLEGEAVQRALDASAGPADGKVPCRRGIGS